MSTQSSTVFNRGDTQKCLICNKEPLPQSSQRMQFIIVELFLLFVNLRAALIVLAIGYYFSHIVWKCPICKRQIDLRYPDTSVEQNVIIRMGNCIGMVTRQKYLMIAGIVCTILGITIGYSVYSQAGTITKNQVFEPSWPNLIRDCGKHIMMDNQVAAENHFKPYKQLSWSLKGVWVKSKTQIFNQAPIWVIKMNPTQNPNTQDGDIILYTYGSGVGHYGGTWNEGDQLSFTGQFILLNNQGFHFMARTITRIPGQSVNLKQIPGLPIQKASNLRNHTKVNLQKPNVQTNIQSK